MIETNAFNGNLQKSPFNFKPYGIRDLSIMAGGKQWPTTAYEMNFNNYRYTRAFVDMFDALNMTNSTETNGITLKKFKDGWTIFVINLTNSGDDDQCFDLIKVKYLSFYS